ncbi:MAG: calcium/sodium antiporter [Flavobacteriales bacterium]|nr:calcium/sodium antiporter [Flavobacteriales bacterium]
MIQLLLIILSLAMLIFAGDILVKGAVSISLKLKIPMMIVGLTVISFATSAPELFVSLQAAWAGDSDISIGNVIGSNIANISIVLGPTALIFPIIVKQRVYRFDWLIMALFSVVFGVFMYTDNNISRIEGGILFAGLLAYVISMVVSVKKNPMEEDDEGTIYPMWRSVSYLIIGIVGLKYGSELLIDQVKLFAADVGISKRVISLTVVAFGTSIPELTASLVAAYQGRKDLSVGNLIGSNIFNIGSVIGLTSLVTPIAITSQSQLFDWAWMMGIAILLLLTIVLNKQNKIGRVSGGLLTLVYILYTVSLFL